MQRWNWVGVGGRRIVPSLLIASACVAAWGCEAMRTAVGVPFDVAKYVAVKAVEVPYDAAKMSAQGVVDVVSAIGR
ncbi:MAG: hypothetical protein AB7G11_11740 [Phycisphaerales bacterium]